ncbi:cupredoxin domain-containing protein [Rhabdothermincola sp.]|uniref:cupredoxin domain-containing protein n=1 Tax=Rhabdothermincola sp. TaxID=2820405 RepID=UPI002FE205C9
MNDHPEVASPEPRPGRSPALVVWAMLAIGAVLMVVAAVGVAAVVLGDRPSEYRVVIPAGTGRQIDAGQSVELIPADLRLKVGTTFVVRNDDDRTHDVGPFAVRAGEQLVHRFDRAGVYQGACTVHPGGQVTITVT